MKQEMVLDGDGRDKRWAGQAGGKAPGRTPRPPKLDGRLEAAFNMVPSCRICADIGADHGRLGAALLVEGRAQHMLVADISPKALEKARKLLERLQLSHRATFAVADGLAALDALPEARADVLCILGMGADTIAGILARGREKLQGAILVLGAQTELPLLREAVVRIDYRIREERPVQAGGRWYLLTQAAPALPGEAAYTQRELFVGPCLLRDKPPQGKAFLLRRRRLLLEVTQAMGRAAPDKDEQRLDRLKRELLCLQTALMEAGWKESES